MKYKKRILSVIFVVMMTLASANFVYGEYHDMRNDEIQIEVPDDWHLEETIDDNSENGSSFERILYAYSDDEPSLDLNVYYLAEETDDYVYLNDDKTDALNYYEEHGRDILTRYYNERAGQDDSKLSEQDTVSLSEAKYYDGEWNGYLKVTATLQEAGSGEQYEELIYMTASEDMVHKLLIFSRDTTAYRAAEMTDTTEAIVESFYDYGYDEVLLGHDDSEYESEDDSGTLDTANLILGFIVMAAPIIIILAVIGGVARRINRNVRACKMDDMGLSSGGSRHQDEWKRTGKDAYAKSKDAFAKVKDAFAKDRASDVFGERLAGTDRTSANNGARELFREKTRKARRTGLDGRPLGRADKARSAQQSTHTIAAAERRITPSDAGEKYIECLRTLCKSGLITKEELRQMIEKYENRR